MGILYQLQRTEDDVNLHDQIVWKLHVNGVDELLLFLGSNSAEVSTNQPPGGVIMIAPVITQGHE